MRLTIFSSFLVASALFAYDVTLLTDPNSGAGGTAGDLRFGVETSPDAAVNFTLDGTVNLDAVTMTLNTAKAITANASGNTIEIANPATPIFTASGNALTLSGNLTVNGDINMGGGALTMDPGGNSLGFNDVISGTSTNVTVTGSGLYAFAGTNTFTGSVTVDSGVTLGLSGASAISSSSGVSLSGTLTGSASTTIPTLTGSNSSASLNLALGTLTVSQGSSGTYAGGITGTGALSKGGAGTLTMTGANTHTGTVAVTAGTLSMANISTSNVAVSSGATFVFAGASTYSGTLSGEGAMQKTGSGTLTISDTNTISGAATLSAGTTVLSDSDTLSSCSSVTVASGATMGPASSVTSTVRDLSGAGNVSLPSGSTLIVDSFGDSTFSGNTSGAGQLQKTGTEQLTVTGTLNHTGGITVSNGSLSVQGATYSGAVTNSGTIELETEGTATFAGAIGGTGIVQKTGTGTQILSGTSTYSGDTTVGEGTLNVTGSIASSEVTVLTGSTLRGTGTLGATTVQGIMWPGASIGTINVAGNYTQSSGSTLQIEIDADGNASKVDATGIATIQSNTTVSVIALAGVYNTDQTYTILEADGGVSGEFTTLTITNPSEVESGTFSLNYLSDSVQLLLVGGGGGSSSLTACDQSQAYVVSNLSGQANLFQSNVVTYENDQRILNWNDACNTPEQRFYGYAVGDYTNGHTSRSNKMIGTSYHVGGVQIGFNMRACENILTGFFGGYSRGWSDAYDHCGKAHSDNYTLGFFSQFFFKVCTFDISGMYTRVELSSERFNTARAKQNSAHPNGNTGNLSVRALFNGKVGKTDVRPILGARWLGTYVNKYKESDSNATRLTYSKDDWNALAVLGGLFVSRQITCGGGSVTPHAKATWIQELFRKTHMVFISNGSGDQLATNIRNNDTGALELAGGLSGTFANCVTIDGTYTANLFQNNAPTQNFRVSMAWNY